MFDCLLDKSSTKDGAEGVGTDWSTSEAWDDAAGIRDGEAGDEFTGPGGDDDQIKHSHQFKSTNLFLKVK